MVTDYVKKSGIETEIYNVDLQNVRPPINIFVYPALFMDAELVAYGEDIIAYFEERLMNP